MKRSDLKKQRKIQIKQFKNNREIAFQERTKAFAKIRIPDELENYFIRHSRDMADYASKKKQARENIMNGVPNIIGQNI